MRRPVVESSTKTDEQRLMAVDRQMMPSALYPQQEENGELEIIIENPESVAMMTEDGGMIIDFDPNNPMTGGLNHDSNLAEFMDDQELRHVSSELIGAYNADKDSREDWEKSYIRGLDLLGLKFEDRSIPWDGACGVFHPMLSDSVVRFQSQTIPEIYPASGPS